MKVLVDTHTHTNVSTHAHSTLLENVLYAKKHRLEMLCMTNHAPNIPDSPHIWHFSTMMRLPREIEGIKMGYGIEANVIDTDGNIDVPEKIQKSVDFVIASMHPPCYSPDLLSDHTETWLKVLDNPYVTILGHTGHPKFPYDKEKVIKKAIEKDTCVEINNGSILTREGSFENCKKIAEVCKELGAKVVVSSDSHSCFTVGIFDEVIDMLEGINFPEELIMNLNADRFLKYLKSKKERAEA